MDGAEVKQKTDDELSGLLTDLKKESLNLRFQQSGGQLENTARVREVRRDLARVKTILNEKKRESAS